MNRRSTRFNKNDIDDSPKKKTRIESNETSHNNIINIHYKSKTNLYRKQTFQKNSLEQKNGKLKKIIQMMKILIIMK